MDRKLTSVWFDLPPSFYRRVQRVAEGCDLSPEQVLRRGVTLVAAKARRASEPAAKQVSRPAAALAAQRWAGTTPAERRAIAVKLARKRWGSGED
jgi:hypothetical protein